MPTYSVSSSVCSIFYLYDGTKSLVISLAAVFWFGRSSRITYLSYKPTIFERIKYLDKYPVTFKTLCDMWCNITYFLNLHETIIEYTCILLRFGKQCVQFPLCMQHFFIKLSVQTNIQLGKNNYVVALWLIFENLHVIIMEYTNIL